jgi:hypothetical protein
VGEYVTRNVKNNFLFVVILAWLLNIVNDQGSTKTIRILTTSVRVVPVGTTLVDLEVILETLAWGNRALSDLASAVHVVGTVLEHAMPMDCSRLVTKIIVNIDDELVADINIDSWTRPLAVDTCRLVSVTLMGKRVLRLV